MAEKVIRDGVADPDVPEDVRAGAAGYGGFLLSVYDQWVLGCVCSAVWRCPRGIMLRLYDRNVGARHLDLGPGTGFFLDRCWFPVREPRVALVDLNENVLRTAGRRIRRYAPALYRRNVLAPLELGPERFDSAGLNLLLHCLPGGMPHKATAIDHVLSCVRPGGRVFGSTVLGRGVRHGRLAVKALQSFNEDGSMSNAEDSLDGLEAELAARFADYRIRVHGSIALFEATAPDDRTED
ncbi:class I SAM-dependent methyltransferase [Amycolatopsis sp. NPDC054798]